MLAMCFQVERAVDQHTGDRNMLKPAARRIGATKRNRCAPAGPSFASLAKWGKRAVPSIRTLPVSLRRAGVSIGRAGQEPSSAAIIPRVKITPSPTNPTR